jgi:peptidoglycan/LPS O-acetylase OafA/YrhL
MPGLDGLRALAVTAVVWHHSHPGFAALPISRNGFLGVDVFFVLSGFLITTLLLSERRATGRISLRNFYVRRSLRIFPLYYLVLAFLAIYFMVMNAGANAAAFFHELPWHASYTSNWVPLESLMAITWSLSTEEQFYLVWPPVLAWCGARWLWPLLAFLGVSQAVNFGMLDGALNSVGLPYAALPILQVTFTPILLGVLLAFGMKLAWFRRLFEELPSWAPLVGAVVLLALANVPGELRGWPRLLFHIATTCVIALVVLRPRSGLVRTLEWRPLVYVGTVSYGVYLLHKLVLHVVNRGFAGAAVESPELLFAVAMLGTVSVAALSYRYFETPILPLKARFR